MYFRIMLFSLFVARSNLSELNAHISLKRHKYLGLCSIFRSRDYHDYNPSAETAKIFSCYSP